MNALAHAVEALYTPDASLLISAAAEEAARCLAAALPAVVVSPGDVPARTLALRGAWLCSICPGATTVSLRHKVCHVLGGMFGLPVLPPMRQCCRTRVVHLPAAGAVMRRALGTAGAVRALRRLADQAGPPGSLREPGLKEGNLPEVADQGARRAVANPRQVSRAQVTDCLQLPCTGPYQKSLM